VSALEDLIVIFITQAKIRQKIYIYEVKLSLFLLWTESSISMS